jgi:hypothetical protein
VDVQEIEVFIDADGKVQIQVRGVKGESCLDLTRELEESLGGQIEQREMTPEAFQGESLPHENRLQQGQG